MVAPGTNTYHLVTKSSISPPSRDSTGAKRREAHCLSLTRRPWEGLSISPHSEKPGAETAETNHFRSKLTNSVGAVCRFGANVSLDCYMNCYSEAGRCSLPPPGVLEHGPSMSSRCEPRDVIESGVTIAALRTAYVHDSASTTAVSGRNATHNTTAFE